MAFAIPIALVGAGIFYGVTHYTDFLSKNAWTLINVLKIYGISVVVKFADVWWHSE